MCDALSSWHLDCVACRVFQKKKKVLQPIRPLVSVWLLELVTRWVRDSFRDALSSCLIEFVTRWVRDSLSSWLLEIVTHWVNDSSNSWYLDYFYSCRSLYCHVPILIIYCVSEFVMRWVRDASSSWLIEIVPQWVHVISITSTGATDYITTLHYTWCVGAWLIEFVTRWVRDSLRSWLIQFMTHWDRDLLSAWLNDCVKFRLLLQALQPISPHSTTDDVLCRCVTHWVRDSLNSWLVEIVTHWVRHSLSAWYFDYCYRRYSLHHNARLLMAVRISAWLIEFMTSWDRDSLSSWLFEFVIFRFPLQVPQPIRPTLHYWWLIVSSSDSLSSWRVECVIFRLRLRCHSVYPLDYV